MTKRDTGTTLRHERCMFLRAHTSAVKFRVIQPL